MGDSVFLHGLYACAVNLQKWQYNLKMVQSHDVAPSLYCTAISICSQHMRRGGAGKSILPLTYFYTSDCISDVSLINNSPDTPNTRAMRDMKSLPRDFSISEAGLAEKDRKNIIPFQVMSRISGNELWFSFLKSEDRSQTWSIN